MSVKEFKFVSWVLYISTSVWVLRTPNANQNSHFQRFSAKKQKKQEFCSKFLQKTRFFEFALKRWSTVLLQKTNNLQLIVGKSGFLREKAVFWE